TFGTGFINANCPIAPRIEYLIPATHQEIKDRLWTFTTPKTVIGRPTMNAGTTQVNPPITIVNTVTAIPNPATITCGMSNPSSTPVSSWRGKFESSHPDCSSITCCAISIHFLPSDLPPSHQSLCAVAY